MKDPDFQTLQRKFAAHLRNPDSYPAPDGIEERRLDIYRNLFFNNVNGFLRQGFPVLHSLLDRERWQRRDRTCFEKHASHTPYFLEIRQEFVSFLASGQGSEPGDPVFMLELAHYEWMELVLDGGSALYGSDAVAGVVNIIPVKEFDGFTTKVYYQGAEQGGTEDINAYFMCGKTFDNGISYVGVFSDKHHTDLMLAE